MLRHDPDIMMVGEVRDLETAEITIQVALTGHLVFSTLHTIDAGQTINRILGFYDHDEQTMIRNRLADTIRWIVSQRLMPRVGGGRIAALEILIRFCSFVQYSLFFERRVSIILLSLYLRLSLRIHSFIV